MANNLLIKSSLKNMANNLHIKSSLKNMVNNLHIKSSCQSKNQIFPKAFVNGWPSKGIVHKWLFITQMTSSKYLFYYGTFSDMSI